MTTGMYRSDRRIYETPYSEKEYFLGERFYPGEFGMVILLGIASLLLWSVAIYGITSEPQPRTDYQQSNSAQ